MSVSPEEVEEAAEHKKGNKKGDASKVAKNANATHGLD